MIYIIIAIVVCVLISGSSLLLKTKKPPKIIKFLPVVPIILAIATYIGFWIICKSVEDACEGAGLALFVMFILIIFGIVFLGLLVFVLSWSFFYKKQLKNKAINNNQNSRVNL